MLQINMTALWVVGCVVIGIGLIGLYAAHKGWLK